jgi:regulator of replication initiation timing
MIVPDHKLVESLLEENNKLKAEIERLRGLLQSIGASSNEILESIVRELNRRT